jgi:hypothetical protein
MTKRRHTPGEIVAKLEEADTMHSEGKLHSEIARALGVSVMTYHRWRKARHNHPVGLPNGPGEPAMSVDPDGDHHQGVDPHLQRTHELQLENTRLRRVVTDLLLEKLKLEEALEERNRSPRRDLMNGS